MYGNSFQTMDLSCPSLLMDTLAIEDQTMGQGKPLTASLLLGASCCTGKVYNVLFLPT